MSRSNEYIKKFASGEIGAPVGEFTKEIDMSTIGSTESVDVFDEFSWAAQVISCQVVSVGLAGTLNGTVDLRQSNDGTNYDTIGSTQTALNSANASNTVEKSSFSGKYLGALITKGGITGGVIKLIFIVKHH